MNLLNNLFGGYANPMPGPHGPPFQRGGSGRRPVYYDSLKALPEEYSEKIGCLKNSNKVLLPPSALNQLAIQQVPNPMIFCIQNMFLNKQTYVGVLEFVAQEGIVIMPTQIFQNLNLEVNQTVSVALTPDIPKGKFIQIQPHETAFIELPDPRAVLEYHLRNYTCFTEGDTISIEFNKKTYKLDILKVKPENQYKSVCVIETDLEIDFAPPLDYQEMKPTSLKKIESTVVYEQEQAKGKEGGEFAAFQGKGMRLDGKPDNGKSNVPANKQAVVGIKEDNDKKEEYDPRKHRLPNGVKTKILIDEFDNKGKALPLGETKEYYKPPEKTTNFKKK